MKRLFICEKASLARTVADALDGTQKKTTAASLSVMSSSSKKGYDTNE